MKTKLKNFLQSNLSIFFIALMMGIACHYFVTTEIMREAEHKYQSPLNLYTSAFGDLKNS